MLFTKDDTIFSINTRDADVRRENKYFCKHTYALSIHYPHVRC